MSRKQMAFQALQYKWVPVEREVGIEMGGWGSKTKQKTGLDVSVT